MNIENSDFVDDSSGLEKIDLLDTHGATSLSYLVRIDGKQYFMKQLRPEYTCELRYRSAFYKEYETGRHLDNRHVVRYESIGENTDGLYLLMEHINGVTLEKKITTDPTWFTKKENVERFLLQLLEGLNALHAHNVAYLDLTPQNVMLTQVSNEVKIIDLGFCFTDGYGHTAGRTLGFAAPELVNGHLDEVDARTDIYAIGRLLQYIKERAHVNFPQHIEHILRRCLQSDRTKRFADVEELTKAIRKRKQTLRSIVIAVLLVVLLPPTAIVLNRTNRVMELKELLAWTLTPSKKDIELYRVHYKITSDTNRTCAVVGGDWHPNAIIMKEVDIKGERYRTTEIMDDAYTRGSHLKSVYLPEGIERIGDNAFRHCNALATIDMPSSLTSLGEWAFAYCDNLTSIKLSPNLKELAHGSFCHNYKLKEIRIPEGVTKLSLDAFACCYDLQSVTLPSTLEIIERGVFYECREMETISIPSAVHTIGEFCFFHCKKLKQVYNHAKEPQIVSRIFMDNDSALVIHVPQASEPAYRASEHWKDFHIVGDL